MCSGWTHAFEPLVSVRRAPPSPPTWCLLSASLLPFSTASGPPTGRVAYCRTMWRLTSVNTSVKAPAQRSLIMIPFASGQNRRPPSAPCDDGEWPIFAQTASFCRNLNNHATNEEERCSCVEYVNLRNGKHFLTGIRARLSASCISTTFAKWAAGFETAACVTNCTRHFRRLHKNGYS